jgi:hypothetical protein
MKMTLEEAIEHCDDVSRRCSSEKCSLEHLQLKKWLEELEERREIMKGSMAEWRFFS